MNIIMSSSKGTWGQTLTETPLNETASQKYLGDLINQSKPNNKKQLSQLKPWKRT